MPEGQVLEFAGLSKRFGPVIAVDALTARVEPGVVTGFLGPNGAGKTTTLRMLLGLVRPSDGHVTIGGKPYARLERPSQTVGAVLEASSFHPGRTAANHLKVYAQAAGLPSSRVDEALATVGLADVAGRKIGGYSLGMRQRLGLAGALLGDPGVLVLDEPANGLDPEGITWMRGLLRELARQGRTVLVSSHLLAEVQQTVDRLLIISQGRLVFQGGLDELADPSEFATVVDSPDRTALAAALDAAGIRHEMLRGGLTVRGADPVLIGEAAARAGVVLSLLQRRGPALEEIFFDLVNGLRVHASASSAHADDTAGVVAEGGELGADEPDTAAVDEHAVTVEAGDQTDAAAGDDAGSDDHEAAEAAAVSAGVESAERGTPGAAFAVAATGVIDIVPPADTAPPHERDADDGDDAPADGATEEVAGEPDSLPAAEPDRLPADEPREARTEADVAADEFFRSFDRSAGETASEDGADTAPESGSDPDSVHAESAAVGDTAASTDERDGGDVR